MKNKKNVKKRAWFLVEVFGIFVMVQSVRYSVGNWGAVSISLLLLSITLSLFIAAFLTARKKDKRNINKPTASEFTRGINY
ncbi:MAG: hypothetical protein HKM87_08430 [Ignavibacteriaceae bacterium]|nr:hypothetical protein [Ignavibacteriaceae bacterium]